MNPAISWAAKSPGEIVSDIAILLAALSPSPNVLVLPRRSLEAIARRTMTRRGFRRWRARARTSA